MSYVATFDDWTHGRSVASFGTNAGAPSLPFQAWRRFKEAFAPELVARAVSESRVPVKRCLDPFGGSGTTALACQFLGIHPATIEVNPFLADLIQAKLTVYNADALARDFALVVRRASRYSKLLHAEFRHLPPTFIEPGVKGRWLFDHSVALRLAAYIKAIREVPTDSHQRFFRVMLGGILTTVSNVVVSGKGRRYRRGWQQRPRDPNLVDTLFAMGVQHAVAEVHRYARRACSSYDLFRGDSRAVLAQRVPCDLAVFSPPYPNSFDYTDVYNVELWMLGYLKDGRSNQTLRTSTICSHVQIGREFPPQPMGSPLLADVLRRLTAKKSKLWDARIPAMVGGYFSDMVTVLRCVHASLTRQGSVWIVVGDSRYANVQIHTAKILAELAENVGWRVQRIEDCRSMRCSPQHGGRPELSETLLVLSLA